MAGMHALHKIIANRTRPSLSRVSPGDFVEIEPDVFGVIVGVNASDVKRLAADLEELGIDRIPLRDRIYAVADHASPAPTVAIAGAQKAFREFFKAHDIRTFDGGAGVSHLVLCEEGLVRPGMLGIAIDSHAPTMGAIGMYACSLGGGRLTLYAIGRYVIEVPKVTLVRVTGTLPPGVPEEESHAMGQLEYPHYTRPAEFRGWKVPDVLLNGNHALIAKWRREQSAARTAEAGHRNGEVPHA